MEVRPFRRDQRFTSVRQNENELQAAGHARVPQDFQRLPMKRMIWTGDGYLFRKVVMMGSVWWFSWSSAIRLG